MLDVFLILLGLAGFAIAGYQDLKTTEFSDWIPYGMITLAIAAKLAYSIATGDFNVLFTSLGNGVLLLAIGMALYYLGQWGDGDGFLIGALGFILPVSTPLFSPEFILPLPASILVNTFLVGSAYMIIYAIALGILNPWILGFFWKTVRKNAARITLLMAAFVLAMVATPLIVASQLGITIGFDAVLSSLYMLPPLAFLVLLWFYAKVIEEKIFIKRVPASKLRLGDIVQTSKLWKGLTRSELADMRKRYKKVYVKEGVRFAPAFLFAFVLMLIYGDVFLLLI